MSKELSLTIKGSSETVKRFIGWPEQGKPPRSPEIVGAVCSPIGDKPETVEVIGLPLAVKAKPAPLSKGMYFANTPRGELIRVCLSLPDGSPTNRNFMIVWCDDEK